MEDALGNEPVHMEQDRRIFEVLEKESRRLRNFIRKRVADDEDAKDILQDVFYEFVAAYRLMKPVEQAGAWLFQVARNRITDLFRKKKHEPMSSVVPVGGQDGEELLLEDILPSPDAGPDAVYARGVLLYELQAALLELPDEQRAVFVAHEIEGRSFKDMAAESGVSINTLLARKRYAVRFLRQYLQDVYDEYEGDL